MKKLSAAALFAALAATGCASDEARERRAAREANPAPCPNIVVLNEASRFIEFDGDQTLENVAYSGEVLDVTSTCRYFEDEPIDAGLTIDLAFGKGAKGVEGKKTFTYFVAVTRKNSEVIAKSEFPIEVNFGDRPVETARVDIDKIIIPRANETISGINFEIIIGFSVTPQQAIFNRSGKSLKFPNLK
ncbi:hypothetical protein [Hyphococcus sp.]|uniref:hypothetical protein n=1 Tax=Hyphococcus sp. TaxID=2038636 RepID=UPI0035C73C78